MVKKTLKKQIKTLKAIADDINDRIYDGVYDDNADMIALIDTEVKVMDEIIQREMLLTQLETPSLDNLGGIL